MPRRPSRAPPPVPSRRSRPAAPRKALPAPTHLDAEFLPDDLVVPADAEEFLDDELVVAEDASPDVVFAGPSDAPPALGPVATPARPARRRWRGASAAAALGLAGLATAVVVIRQGGREVVTTATATPTATPTPTATATATPTATATATPTATPPPPDSTSPSDAKQSAQQALDHGKPSLAIDQGERAVTLDPSDAEAWLILGAAYLQRGKYGEARRCFSSCVHLADAGAARSECAALLR